MDTVNQPQTHRPTCEIQAQLEECEKIMRFNAQIPPGMHNREAMQNMRRDHENLLHELASAKAHEDLHSEIDAQNAFENEQAEMQAESDLALGKRVREERARNRKILGTKEHCVAQFDELDRLKKERISTADPVPTHPVTSLPETRRAQQ